ncbi:CAAX protease [Clostridium carboxidivorans P7]|uniref:Abortive infection protein n=1 Tax=Clostridium carboxidivorans P7 TaxID=536227 RepID=C6Q2E5_9CLOT|nr:CPBP family intramembrane glutamic endopeptidase [Clostridium carboxidivorans]AKN32680.1 CAAX protease [Clostridium carboxidivorans P7]EET84335.1 Abortive infection protein [Clostridium carboxidivorans P7]EFG90087.1 CAAX amino terminal protease family protein [Clostridium carboxidivorans P7]
MVKYDIIKDLLVFLFVYVPPIVIFIRFSAERNRSKIVLAIVALVYLIASLFTNNIFPFIFTIINIKYLKDANRVYSLYSSSQSLKQTLSQRLSDDFKKFGFSLKKFNIVSAIRLTTFSYVVIIIIANIETMIVSKFNVQVKEQEVVTWMSNMPLNRFLIIIPIVIIFAPILEEFVFRWLLFEKTFAPRIGIYLAALLSSIIFGVIHFNLRAFPLLIWIGIYNCYLIEKKGYWYSVFNHFTFNFVTTMALLISKLS